MNFLNAALSRITDRFDPNSPGFGGGMVGGIMNQGAAPMPAPGIDNADATHQQEAMARSRGFQTYDQMLNWSRQRQMHRDPQTIGRDGPAPEMPTTMGQAGQQAMAIHPKTILDWVTHQIMGATGQ